MQTNPVLSLLNECGVKPAEFAEEYGFSRQAVDYLINGVYPQLSDRFEDALLDEASECFVQKDYLDIADEYEQWRLSARQEIADKYLVRPRPVWDQATSPFDTYVKDTAGNRSRFAKDMKVPVRDVTRYARGEALTMPMELQQAFDTIGFGWKAELIGMQYNWRTEYR